MNLHRSMNELRAQLKVLGQAGGSGLDKVRLLAATRRAWDEKYADVVDEAMEWRDRDIPDDLARSVLLDLVAVAYMGGYESRRTVRSTPTPGGPVMPAWVSGTHWIDCWRAHLDCAVARVERLEAEKRQVEVSHAALADAYARVQGGSIEVGEERR